MCILNNFFALSTTITTYAWGHTNTTRLASFETAKREIKDERVKLELNVKVQMIDPVHRIAEEQLWLHRSFLRPGMACRVDQVLIQKNPALLFDVKTGSAKVDEP